MRALVLSLLVGVTFAAPQGYNYQIQDGGNSNDNFAINQFKLQQQQLILQQQQQQYQQQIGLIAEPEASLQPQNVVQQQQPQPEQVIQSEVQQQALPLQQIQPEPQLQFSSEPQPQQQYQPSAPSGEPQTSQYSYNKEFYYLSAPPENDQLPIDFQDQVNKIKKNIRVIFIKAPENNGLTSALLQLNNEVQNSKTAIYVLTKQHDAGVLASKLQQLPSPPQEKPEVIFIKYRTKVEAEHAQRTIQSQYESIKGPNHINFETEAAVHDFNGSNGGATGNGVALNGVSAASVQSYLPPTQ